MDAPRPRGVRAALARRPVPALVRMAWRADRGGVAAIIFGAIFKAAATIGSVVTIGILVDAIIEKGDVSGSTPWIALGAVAAILFVQRVAFPFLDPAIESLEHRLTILVQQRVMSPLLRPVTIGHLEDAGVDDQLRLAQQVGSENFSAQQALGALTDLASTRLACTVAAGILFTWRWWAPRRPARRLAPLPDLVPHPDGQPRHLHGARHPRPAPGRVRQRAHPRRHGGQGDPHLRPRPLAARPVRDPLARRHARRVGRPAPGPPRHADRRRRALRRLRRSSSAPWCGRRCEASSPSATSSST